MHALILGIVQGITEFLPISSSAHLLLLPYIAGWNPSGLAFDVALHLGTLAAVLIYFFSTWRRLVVDGLWKRNAKELQLIYYLLIATIPAALIGYFAEDLVEHTLRQPIIAAIMLIVFGLILYAADKTAKQDQKLESFSWKRALFIGFAQVAALIPGVSRSGVTMSAGLVSGLSREEAAQFSFLLLAPITGGAVLFQLGDALATPDKTSLVIGIVTSFIVGIAAMHFLLAFIKKYGFGPYVWYRVVVGLLLIFFILRG